MSFEQAAKWLTNHIDAVPACSVVIVLVCLLFHRLGIARWSLRSTVYFSATISLAAGYAFAFSYSFAPLVNLLIIAPQSYILLGMAIVVAAAKALLPNYRTPSPWWVLLVACIGHGWTHMWIYALSG